jgi:glycosyltransferase involved in cell wall biosynthesis
MPETERGERCRVSIVCHGIGGGMEHYAAGLTGALNSQAFARLTFVDVPVGQHVASTLDASVESFRLEGVRNRVFEKYNGPAHERVAKTIAVRDESSIVHFINRGACLPSMVAALEKIGRRTVYTIHDPVPHEEHRSKWTELVDAFYWNRQLPRIIALSSRIHVHSEKHRAVLVSRYGEWCAQKIYVVQHGASLSKEIAGGRDVPQELKGLDRNRPVVLFFGRIEPYKGLQLLLDATRMLRSGGLSVQVIIAGSGSIAGYDGLSVDGNVLINRYIPDSEIKELFGACDLVVLPYLTATQSGVVPLAYLLGKGVVATNVGAIEEIVIDGVTGRLVGPQDAKQLARAMEELLSDQQLLKGVNAGARHYALGSLGEDVVARAHVKEYMTAIGLGDKVR